MRKKNFPLTIEERKLIQENIEKNIPLSEISKIIKRSKNAVIKDVRRNGGRENYNSQIAHNEAKIRNEERIKKITKNINTGEHPYTSLKNRIENLEMQIEILSDTLKDLTRKK